MKIEHNYELLKVIFTLLHFVNSVFFDHENIVLSYCVIKK